MRQKIFDDVTQEILEVSMEVGMQEPSAFRTGRLRGLQDALDAITRLRHSASRTNQE